MGDIAQDIQSSFPSERIKAFINLKFTANWINNKEVLLFKPYGISPQQYNILRILRGADAPLKAQTIKERMIERAPNATRLMDKLCDKELVTRYRCNNDRRVVFVTITKQGLELLETIGNREQIDFLNNLTDAEVTQLNLLLDKIR